MNKINIIQISKKIKYLLVLIGIVFIVSIALPTYSRYKNRTSYYQVEEWDGSIASKYRAGDGSKNNPYIISNGSEFAFFLEMLKITSYDGIYFKINNDIVLNKGLFTYENDTLKYTYDDVTYDVNSANINEVSMVDTFNGYIDGNFNRIYGLYISSNEEETSIFKNLGGNISDLYIENSVVTGGNITSGLAINASNNNIKNLVYNGFIIGNNNNIIKSQKLEDINTNISGIINLPPIEKNGNITNIKINGVYSKTGDVNELKINNQIIEEGEFSIELDSTLETINYEIVGEGNVLLSDLEYTYLDDYSISSGLIINASNIVLENVVNRSYVKSNTIASGIIFNSENVNVIKNSYNKGKIDSNISCGLVNEVSGELNITKCYNSGELTSQESYSFINNINIDSDVTINNSFATNGSYGINSVNSNTLNINNSYVTNGSIKENNSDAIFNITNKDNFMTSSFIKNTLLFDEYLVGSETINDNVWIISDNEYPIIYIDDLTNQIAKINISMFSWNNYSQELNTLKFSNRFIFNITTNELSNIKDIYYYIQNSDEVITNDELENIEWTKYNDLIEVNEVGTYIIYAKIVDSNNNITYINSDILSIDLDTSIISVNIYGHNYNTNNSLVNYLYINEKSEVTININEDYTELSDVSYYVSDVVLDEEMLNILPSSNWIKYEKFSVSYETPKIIYFRVKDNTDYYSYVNTDYILLKGYTQSDLTVGRNITSGNNLNITSNSSIKFDSSMDGNIEFKNTYKHILVFNKLLPENTKIVLIDNNFNKVYEYFVSSDDIANNLLTFNLSDFKEVGKGNNNVYFNDNNYIGNINENFTFVIDFNKSNIENNILDISAYLQIVDNDLNNIITTLKKDINKFSVYKNFNDEDINAKYTLNSTYNTTINYNMDYVNTIPYEIELNYYNNENITIYDSSLEDMKYGLQISLYNETTSSNMDKKYLRNVLFKYNGINYHPNSNNVVNINLNNNLDGIFNIQTYTDNFNIEDSDYSFKICPYISYDGTNYAEVDSSKCKFISLIMNGNEKTEYSFDVLMNNEHRVISKGGIKTFEFNILQMTELDDPNVRVSLYKKKELTAYDQSYEIIDIMDYMSGQLDLFSPSTAYAIKNATNSSEYRNYVLNLDTTNLELNGYKFLFELYDGDELITTLEKKFIIKKGGDN